MTSSDLISKKLRWGMAAIGNIGKPVGRPIFIVGTGRSGTHFLTQCLLTNSKITDLTGGKENLFVFREVVRAALYGGELREGLAKKLIERYRFLMRVAAPKSLLDQSHPNLWLAEQISSGIPSSRFIAIVRDPLSVAYSTLHHAGVLKRLVNWEKYPIPNDFLGIDLDNVDEYRRMSLMQRSALRWAAHIRQMNKVEQSLAAKVHFVRYEDLCLAGEGELKQLADFLEEDSAKFSVPDIKMESLSKKRQLNENDQREVLRVAGNYLNRIRLRGKLRSWVDEYLSQESFVNSQ